MDCYGGQQQDNKQWGVSTTSFPISVSAVYSIIAAKKDTSANSVPDVQNYSSTGFAYYGPSPYAWFAVCKAQQWGRSTAATLNFSLPFQKFYCITTAQESWSSATFDNTSWITRTNISVTWPTYLGTNINYIAVGMQQCFKRCAFGKAQALPMATHQKPAQPLPAS